MYATLTTAGAVTEHEGIPDLEALQAVVAAGTKDGQGWVEACRVKLGGVDVVMWLHEEGKYAGPGDRPLATNSIATGIALDSRSIRLTDWICGDVVFTGSEDDEGETTSLPVEALDSLKAVA